MLFDGVHPSVTLGIGPLLGGLLCSLLSGSLARPSASLFRRLGPIVLAAYRKDAHDAVDETLDHVLHSHAPSPVSAVWNRVVGELVAAVRFCFGWGNI